MRNGSVGAATPKHQATAPTEHLFKIHYLLPSSWKRTLSKLKNMDVKLHKYFVHLATTFPVRGSSSSAVDRVRSEQPPADWHQRLSRCDTSLRQWISEHDSANLADWLRNRNLLRDLRTRPHDATIDFHTLSDDALTSYATLTVATYWQANDGSTIQVDTLIDTGCGTSLVTNGLLDRVTDSLGARANWAGLSFWWKAVGGEHSYGHFHTW